ncbi:hypothetical protein D9619_013434 [Psilocybe cf. subviscida]|uniref:Uncharacterized protein n=1 Tax=Psilocybe cf. subviscida TaxID=2480587 RepID=A0A8H5BRT3_9AGAR|nr:hypothetical protein D9619_013434 [Psilocybe cf. subviscida]
MTDNINLGEQDMPCPEAFGSYLDPPSSTTDYPMNTVGLDCPSTVLNIIIHALYDISPESYEPSADIIISSVDLMPGYAIMPEKVIFPGCVLYDYILGFMPLRPLDVYAMAAHHKIHPLAVHASSYLHSIDTHLIAEDVCIRIGPVYLTKLARLHVQRFTALKDALLLPPEMHPATPNCTLKQQHDATRVWAHLCADPIWDTKPVDLAVQAIENTLQQLMGSLPCPDSPLAWTPRRHFWLEDGNTAKYGIHWSVICVHALYIFSILLGVAYPYNL